MDLFNISEAKAKLSAVIERVTSKGESILIGKAGKPVAMIVPYDSARENRRLGLFSGKIEIAKDFDEWPDDMAQSWGL
jgi:prevent-host-death family protein